MTIDEVIYCMKSYLPDSRLSCIECPYYGSFQIDSQTFICRSSEAHKMAIEALEKLKNINNEHKINGGD